jgi:hypothetical protein
MLMQGSTANKRMSTHTNNTQSNATCGSKCIIIQLHVSMQLHRLQEKFLKEEKKARN